MTIQRGRVARLSISDGGVPKRPVPEAEVGPLGLLLDRQANRIYHGGPERAVSLFSLEVIDLLRAEGHPIAPGSTGENVTLRGLDWHLVTPGARLSFASGVTLEVSSFCTPCKKIAASFAGGDVARISQRTNPGWSRVYSRVLTPGLLVVDDEVTLDLPPQLLAP